MADIDDDIPRLKKQVQELQTELAARQMQMLSDLQVQVKALQAQLDGRAVAGQPKQQPAEPFAPQLPGNEESQAAVDSGELSPEGAEVQPFIATGNRKGMTQEQRRDFNVAARKFDEDRKRRRNQPTETQDQFVARTGAEPVIDGPSFDPRQQDSPPQGRTAGDPNAPVGPLNPPGSGWSPVLPGLPQSDEPQIPEPTRQPSVIKAPTGHADNAVQDFAQSSTKYAESVLQSLTVLAAVVTRLARQVESVTGCLEMNETSES